MAWDSGRGRMVLFGGWNGQQQFGDTWEWDGSGWSDRSPGASRPVPRAGHAMVFDTTRNRVLLVGGQDGASATAVRQDAWEWDGQNWTDRTPASGLPPARRNHAMAWDGARAEAVLFGGAGAGTTRLADTWLWNGTAWSERLVATRPDKRRSHAMAFDAGRGRVVLFGGVDDTVAPYGKIFGDTWEWDGTAWAQQATTGPHARSGHAMFYDAVRGRVVLFGGYNGVPLEGFPQRDVWEWDGTAWTERTPASGGPRARFTHAMAFAPPRGDALLFGGNFSAGAMILSDLWSWGATGWSEVPSPGIQPDPRYLHALAFDSPRERLVLFGGLGYQRLQDTWELDVASSRRPAVQFSPSLAVAGFPASRVAGMRVRGFCGGRSGPGGGPEAGAALLGWAMGGSGRLPGCWTELDRNAAGIADGLPQMPEAGAALLDWTAPDAPEAQRFLLDRDMTMAFQCRPAGTSGSGSAQVALDHVEVRVRYRPP